MLSHTALSSSGVKCIKLKIWKDFTPFYCHDAIAQSRIILCISMEDSVALARKISWATLGARDSETSQGQDSLA